MLSNTALPHITALTMEEKLSSKITMSDASLATEKKEREDRCKDDEKSVQKSRGKRREKEEK